MTKRASKSSDRESITLREKKYDMLVGSRAQVWHGNI